MARLTVLTRPASTVSTSTRIGLAVRRNIRPMPCGPRWVPLAVAACARDRAIEGGSPVDAETSGWIAAGVVDATGDEGHRVGLVVHQMRGIRDQIIELLACGCGKLARLGSDVC